MGKYRIVKFTYESNESRYQIQQKFLWFWFDVGGEYWETLQFARKRLVEIGGQKVVTKVVVE